MSSKKKTYVYPNTGKKVTVEKSVWFETAGRSDPSKVTKRYALVGKDEEGKSKFVLVAKDVAEKYGKPEKKGPSKTVRKPKKSCEEKFDECKSKRKAAKKGKAGKSKTKKSPKKEESDEGSDESESERSREKESEEREKASAESESGSDSESEETPKKKSPAKKAKRAPAKGAKRAAKKTKGKK
jgi:hypothetical protein